MALPQACPARARSSKGRNSTPSSQTQRDHFASKVLILRLRLMPFMDFTGLRAPQDAVRKLQQRGVRVMPCEANHRAR